MGLVLAAIADAGLELASQRGQLCPYVRGKANRLTRVGSGGGSVGRAVASSTRDPWFESQYRQSFIHQL